MYLQHLVLTILVEVFIAFLLGFRSRYQLTCITLIDCVTNPLVNFAFQKTLYLFYTLGWSYVALLELVVIIVEFIALKLLFRSKAFSVLKLSIIMNVASFFIGLLIL